MYELYFCRANLYSDSVVGQLSLPDQPGFRRWKSGLMGTGKLVPQYFEGSMNLTRGLVGCSRVTSYPLRVLGVKCGTAVSVLVTVLSS